jgi:hypothetical protein
MTPNNWIRLLVVSLAFACLYASKNKVDGGGWAIIAILLIVTL